MNIERIFKLLLPAFLLISSLLYNTPAISHHHKQKIGLVAGTTTGGYIGSKYRDMNYYQNRNRSRVYIGFNYGYPSRYRRNHFGYRYHAPLSYRRHYHGHYYDHPRYYRGNYNRRYGNSDQIITTATGVFIGALIGNEIVRYLDDVDHIRARNADVTARSAPIGQRINWNNPQTNHYGSTTATRDGYSETGKYCREFYQTISIGQRTEQGYAVACRQPDGSWKHTGN